MPGRRGNPGLRGKLIEKSIEAHILSLETINRLSIAYRVETFAYLICNAWELLLKAKILSESSKYGSIYEMKERGKTRRSITLASAIGRVLTDTQDPVRRNLERIESFRNEAAHLVVRDVPKDALVLFQSCVLNYHAKLGEWFGLSLSDRVAVGMMTIVYDFAPEQFDAQSSLFRRKFGKETALYLAKFQADVRREYEELGRPREYAIGLDYTLALVKSVQAGDITLTKGDNGPTVGVVEVPRDAGTTHPFRQKELLDYLNAHLQGATTLNTHDITCVIKGHNIEQRPDFFYKSTVPSSPKQYSTKFADWVSQKIGDDPNFISHAREQERQARNVARRL